MSAVSVPTRSPQATPSEQGDSARHKSLQAAGTAVGALAVVAGFAALPLYATEHGGLHAMVASNGANNLVLGVSLGVLGVVLVRARERNPLSWIIAGTALANSLSALGDAYAGHAFGPPSTWPFAAGAAWISSWTWAAGFVPAFTVLLARYPTGRPTSRAWRVVDRLGWAATVAASVGLALARDAFDDVAPRQYAPFGAAANQVGAVLFGLGFLGGLALGATAAVATLVRLHRASTPVRQQLAWLLVSIIPVTISAIVAPTGVTLSLIPLVPTGIGVGILRYRLLDIELVLRRALLYGLLTGIVVGVYTGVVAGLTALVPHGPFPQLLAAAAIVVGLHPGYNVLRTWVDRYVYGDRHDPVRAATRLGRELASADDADGPLPRVARTVAAALRVPYVALTTEAGTIEHGTPATPLHKVELHYAGRPVGRLDVAHRTPLEPLTSADLALLDLLAGPVGITVHATRLADELSASRERLLAAVEQERARLRNDLHDGLGPSLTGVALGLEAAQYAADHPATVRPLLERLRSEVNESLLDVRRLVDGLRPAALDASDLADALREHAAAVTARTEGLRVEVEAPDKLPVLPKEIEVTAYRIALEALTNVVRHADARHCVVRVACQAAELVIEVHDDGHGIAPSARAGVGLESMRARAAEVGGEVQVGQREPTGTSLLARLPLGTSA